MKTIHLIVTFISLFCAPVMLAFDRPADNKAAAVFTNPILQGGFPDPSICRVGDDFYVVNSTFEYFPGLPIHHSKDLINWELIGYGLHQKSQVTGAVNLIDVQSDGGIHAPTLRCHEGKFYIITTNVYYDEVNQRTDFVNFVITAENPSGPWSEPHVLEGAPGIDPDIFFDDDGKVWYVGTQSPEEPNFPGEGEIWLQEIDTNEWKLIGERHYLWRGACGGVWVEGPHIYKKDGRYYLLVAEGGTSFNHAVMVAVADEITGPYQSNARNPILSTRHLSYRNWVHSTGHGDLVELADGRWYMVLLGIRGDIETASNMGRETHLVPVTWEREPFWWQEEKILWPVVSPETGRVERRTPVPFVNSKQSRKLHFSDQFDSDSLKLEWNFRRLPLENSYSLSASKDHLRMFAKPEIIRERGRANLMGFRQTESDFQYTVKLKFEPADSHTEAGIMLFQKDNNFIKATLKHNSDDTMALAIVHSGVENDSSKIDKVSTLGSVNLSQTSDYLYLRIDSMNDEYQFLYSVDNDSDYALVAKAKADGVISRKYTGANLGLYITSNGMASDDFMDVDWVKYTAYERN